MAEPARRRAEVRDVCNQTSCRLCARAAVDGETLDWTCCRVLTMPWMKPSNIRPGAISCAGPGDDAIEQARHTRRPAAPPRIAGGDCVSRASQRERRLYRHTAANYWKGLMRRWARPGTPRQPRLRQRRFRAVPDLRCCTAKRRGRACQAPPSPRSQCTQQYRPQRGSAVSPAREGVRPEPLSWRS